MGNKKLKLLYEVSLAILAILTVSITLFDLSERISAESSLLKADSIILAIFAVDYFVLLIMADSRKVFIKKNIFDLIAIRFQ